MTILDQSIEAGEEVRFNSKLCKNVTGSSEIHIGLRSIDTGRYFDAGMEYGNNPKGCMDIIQHFHVPQDTPPGDYQVWVMAVLEVNGFRTDRYKLPMGEITITAKKE